MTTSKYISKQFKPFNSKPGTFFGSIYSRGGRLVDKYKNVRYEPVTYRSVHFPNIVLSSRGKILGGEKNRQHEYGLGVKPIKLKRIQSQQEKKIMMTLRKRGRL